MKLLQQARAAVERIAYVTRGPSGALNVIQEFITAAELAALRRQLEACAIYLKPGETPRERMDRDAGDSAALMKLFEAEKRTTEALRSELEDARKALATCKTGG